MSPTAWLALAAFLLLLVLVVAAAVNPYEQFEAEAHAHDSDEDPPPIPGTSIPELDRLNDDPAEPTTGELRDALRQTAEREGDDWLKALRGEGS